MMGREVRAELRSDVISEVIPGVIPEVIHEVIPEVRRAVNAEGAPALETRIGVGVLVLRDGRVLLGERRGSHGAGTWSPPGGHLEAGEMVEACAGRELHEETGMVLRAWHAGPWSVNDFPDVGRRYATLFVVVTEAVGEPRVCEPDKCAGWHWVPWSALVSGQVGPLFAPLASMVTSGWVPQGEPR